MFLNDNNNNNVLNDVFKFLMMFQIIAKPRANNASHTMHRTSLVWRGLDESVEKVGACQSR